MVDDGSTDKTKELVDEFIKDIKNQEVILVTQENAGKAHALNNALKNFAKGELIMCLDADSTLDNNALNEASLYFTDKKVVAMAANVKIRPTKGLLNFIQQYEYIVCYQMKRALTVFNIEYIIGGIGSVFRLDILKQINYYDTNTITEDIDLTMKLLQLGNKNYKVIYGSKVIVYTESVLTITNLIKQRYRWKFGRSQTFYKHWNLFFNRDKKHNKLLTWVYLPFAIYSDVAFFFEPILVSFIFYVVIKYGDLTTLVSALIVVGGYITINVIMENTIAWRKRLLLAIMAPTMYIFFLLLSFVEYVALIRGLINIHKVKQSVASGVCGWQHVERPKST